MAPKQEQLCNDFLPLVKNPDSFNFNIGNLPRTRQLAFCRNIFYQNAVLRGKLDVLVYRAWNWIQDHQLYTDRNQTESEYLDEIDAEYNIRTVVESQHRICAAKAAIEEIWEASIAEILGALYPPNPSRDLLECLRQFVNDCRDKSEAVRLLDVQVVNRVGKPSRSRKDEFIIHSDVIKAIEAWKSHHVRGTHSISRPLGSRTRSHAFMSDVDSFTKVSSAERPTKRLKQPAKGEKLKKDELRLYIKLATSIEPGLESQDDPRIDFEHEARLEAEPEPAADADGDIEAEAESLCESISEPASSSRATESERRQQLSSNHVSRYTSPLTNPSPNSTRSTSLSRRGTSPSATTTLCPSQPSSPLPHHSRSPSLSDKTIHRNRVDLPENLIPIGMMDLQNKLQEELARLKEYVRGDSWGEMHLSVFKIFYIMPSRHVSLFKA